jgi:mRNA interferase RelE/StbE
VTYALHISPRAQKELEKITGADYQRIKSAVLDLASEPRPHGCKKLSGRDGWRIRIGDYRVLFDIDDARRAVLVLDVGHRRDIYR